MSLASIKKRARNGTLAVEHLLKAAVHPDHAMARLLGDLADELEWQWPDEPAHGSRPVPLAAWAKVVGTYCSEGHAGVARLAHDPAMARFVIGLLEELRTQQALDTLLTSYDACLAEPERHGAVAFRVAEAVNCMLSLKPELVTPPAQAARLRSFLTALYPKADRDADRARVLLALRGVGDEASISMASGIRLAYPWQDVPQHVVKSVRKRLFSPCHGARPLDAD